MAAKSPATVTARPITLTPGARVLDVSTPSSNGRSDEGIWKRLRDAGFDEESIRRRDKAALIAYIAKLEAEVYELQHNMGLLILERKDYASKYEEARLASESVEVIHMRDQAALSSALAEAKKREDNLKKALGVEKECVANIEKALHELRAECAEVKVTAESKMVEAHTMVEDAQKKYIEAEAKLHAAESLQDEARRCERAAGRKLHEVEAREDDLRRRIVSFKSECDAKEKEVMLERQSLAERQKVLNEAQNKLLDGQALLNQREAGILSRSQALRKVEKELEDEKENIAAEHRALMEQKSNLELKAMSLSEREKAVTEKEVLLNKKEKELLVSQENLANKEHNEIQKIIAEKENILKHRRIEFEAELLRKQKVVEEDIETKRRAWELRELDLKQREDYILEKEQDLEVQSRVIADKGKDLAEKMRSLEERESNLNKGEKEVELTKILLQKEREEFDQVTIDLEKSLLRLEEEKKKLAEAEKELQLMKSETSELLIWETKLKEEIDMIRAQKLELEAEAEKLKVEKAKFETEWETIDEKREELRREEERIAGERLTISKFLKEERDSLILEKDALREQYKRDLESLSHDREAFRSESQRERSDWFSKFEQERADFLLDIECRKRELEDCVNKRREDVESYLREKEKAFEEEMKRELEYISSLKEDLVKEQELVASELKKLETEKLEIKLDRQQRDKAWAELQSLIEELQMQRLKLKEQRELLHADREQINSQIEHLKKLEDLKVDSDRIVVPVQQQAGMESTPEVFKRVPQLESAQQATFADNRQDIESDSPPGSTVSWIKRCASLIFKNTPDKVPTKDIDTSLESESENEKLGFIEKEAMRISAKIRSEQGMLKESAYLTSVGSLEQSGGTAFEEPKVIHEVPSADEDATDMRDQKAAKNVLESSIPASSRSSAGRKRRVDDLSATEIDSVLSDDEKVNKKRRQLAADAPDGSHNVAPQCEASKKKAVDRPDEAGGDSDITPKINDAENCPTEVQESEVDKSGLNEDEALRCVIVEQTVIQEILIVNEEGANRSHESQEEVPSESNEEQEHVDPPETNLDKPENVNERVTRRSKAKQKA